MKPIYHANANAKRWGGRPADYMAIHDLLDSSKAAHPDIRHRAILHSTFGIEVCTRVLGETLPHSDGGTFSVRKVAEDHLRQDCVGRVPEPADYLRWMVLQDWMEGDGGARDARWHAVSSARRWGGAPEEYLDIHAFLDAPDGGLADGRGRAILHHSFGVALVERVFGWTLTTSAGRTVPVRALAEEHVKRDLGLLPSLGDWLHNMRVQPWMHGSDREETPGGRRGTPRLRTLDDPVGTTVRATETERR